MVLIIAEKPSLARNIVAAIGPMDKRNGFFEGQGYLVSWAFGHLFSLCDIEEYTPGAVAGGRWSMDNLPCFPDKFRFKLRAGADKKPDAGVERQFATIKALCNRPDVDTIINAGDSDREGEIIIRLCIENALESEKKLRRLWMPDQTPETIRAGLAEMRDESEFDHLANEGFARTYIDWLYGVNLTRYATLRTGMLLRVGRVIVPIVRAIYERDMQIKNFVPGIYYALTSKEETNGETVELTSKKKFDKEKLAAAQAECEKYNREKALVTAKRVRKTTLEAGKLYSLSKLQSFLGKKHKMSMEQSLSIVQKLYEEGYVTYPRTNSEYLATAEKDKVKKVLSSLSAVGYPVAFKDKKTIFDDAKIESHSALTPTYKIPEKGRLSEDEAKVYSAILRRFVAVFCSEDCIVEKTEITVSVGELEDFSLKGNVILQKGWTKYDDYTAKDKVLPALSKGDEVNILFRPTEKETTPPKHYTIETLNNYLKNPFKEDKAAAAENAKAAAAEPDSADGEGENDEEDYRAMFEGLELGTEATRTSIIDNARKSGYIELKKDVYYILPGGIYLIESLARLKINMDKYKTSEMGRALKKVYRGAITVDDSVSLAEKEIGEIFASHSDEPPETDTDTGYFMDVIGKCPVCGHDVIKGKYSYGCRGYKDGCGFSVRLSICDRVISKKNMELLLATGKTSKIRGFVSKKTGKTFDAYLKLENGEAKFDFSD